jgi:hypothetical protein
MNNIAALLRSWLAKRSLGPLRAAEPRWSDFTSYTDLSNAAHRCLWLGPEAFLGGPLRRFLELASDPHVPPRARARIMEFARGSWSAYHDAAAARGEHGTALDARALAMVEAEFADVPSGDYMIDVFEGLATHNWTADVPRQFRAKARPSPDGTTTL